MSSEIVQYLSENAITVHDPKDANFITFYNPRSQWLIDGEQDGFWNKYCEAVSADHYNELDPPCVAEPSKNYMPVIVEFNLSFHRERHQNGSPNGSSDDEYFLGSDEAPSEDNEDNLYGTNYLMSLVMTCQETISKVYYISVDKVERWCFILEPDSYVHNIET